MTERLKKFHSVAPGWITAFIFCATFIYYAGEASHRLKVNEDLDKTQHNELFGYAKKNHEDIVLLQQALTNLANSAVLHHAEALKILKGLDERIP